MTSARGLRLVVPFGFYGYGNIGDEATLQGFARLLRGWGHQVSVAVASQNPGHNASVEPAFAYFHMGRRDPRRWLAKLRASAHVFAGGTPIMDVLGDWPLSQVVPLVQSTDSWRVPVSFVGVGIETLRRDHSRRLVASEIVPRVRHWSVRSARDRDRLVEYGASPAAVTVAADMAWLIEPARDDFGRDCLTSWGLDVRRPIVGVNVVNENGLFDRSPELVEALASALDTLAARLDAQVLFLSNEIRQDPSFDTASALAVKSRMTRATGVFVAPNVYFSPRQMMSIIACCRLTMSMRYHFCLFSALQQVPFIAIERTDKLADLCWDLRWPSTLTPAQVDAASLLTQCDRLESDRWLLDDLNGRVAILRERALASVAALEVLGQPSQRTSQPLALGTHGGRPS